MTPTIRIDDEVFKALQSRAEPLVDSPNDVLRRLLGLDVSGHVGVAAPRRARLRLRPGSTTNKQVFRGPILLALSELGGSRSASEVLARVEMSLDARLSPLDRERLPSGDLWWRKQAHFERLSMVKDGLLEKNSPHGLWELTDQGWKEARDI
jgi:hypothetical protein